MKKCIITSRATNTAPHIDFTGDAVVAKIWVCTRIEGGVATHARGLAFRR